MKIGKKYFDRKGKIKLRKVKAIVVHWDGGGISTIDGLWNWMNYQSANYYLQSN